MDDNVIIELLLQRVIYGQEPKRAFAILLNKEVKAYIWEKKLQDIEDIAFNKLNQEKAGEVTNLIYDNCEKIIFPPKIIQQARLSEIKNGLVK